MYIYINTDNSLSFFSEVSVDLTNLHKGLKEYKYTGDINILLENSIHDLYYTTEKGLYTDTKKSTYLAEAFNL